MRTKFAPVVAVASASGVEVLTKAMNEYNLHCGTGSRERASSQALRAIPAWGSLLLGPGLFKLPTAACSSFALRHVCPQTSPVSAEATPNGNITIPNEVRGGGARPPVPPIPINPTGTRMSASGSQGADVHEGSKSVAASQLSGTRVMPIHEQLLKVRASRIVSAGFIVVKRISIRLNACDEHERVVCPAIGFAP
jgi:hypothetical protein